LNLKIFIYGKCEATKDGSIIKKRFSINFIKTPSNAQSKDWAFLIGAPGMRSF